MVKKLILLLATMALLFSAACTPQTPAAPVVNTQPAESQPVAASTTAPTAEPPAAPQPVTLTILAAASLTEAFQEMQPLFEQAHPGVSLSFNFAGSQQLAQQLTEGAPADVFASANKKQMDVVIAGKRITTEASKVFAKNRLVVIYPQANPGKIEALKDLSKSGLKLVLAAKEVPVGGYSLEFLDKASKDAAYGADFQAAVLKNVVSYENNVKAVLTKVVLGEADGGIVYSTDISASAKDKVGKLDIPDALNVIASYPIAPLADSKNAELAQAFVDMVLGNEGQQILAKYGFITPGGGSAAAAPAASGAKTIQITDALGRKVEFAKAPQRIVVTGKALFMIADAIYAFPEAGQRIVAIGSTNQSGHDFLPIIDANFAQKTQLKSDAGPEQIAAAQPDAVILKSSMAEKLGKPLEAIHIPVVYVDFETAEQYQRDLKTLGQLFENEARANEIAKFYQDEVSRISAPVSQLQADKKPRALLLYYNDKDGAVAFNVPPAGWMQTYLIETAGGQAVWKDANPGQGWSKVSLEQIAAWDADVIFIASYFKPVGEVVAGLKADAQWQALRAVKENKLYGFAGDVYSWDQPDPRWILGLQWVAQKLHPEKYADVKIDQQAQTFYKTLYGMDAAAFQAKIVPLFNGDLP